MDAVNNCRALQKYTRSLCRYFYIKKILEWQDERWRYLKQITRSETVWWLLSSTKDVIKSEALKIRNQSGLVSFYLLMPESHKTEGRRKPKVKHNSQVFPCHPRLSRCCILLYSFGKISFLGSRVASVIICSHRDLRLRCLKSFLKAVKWYFRRAWNPEARVFSKEAFY